MEVCVAGMNRVQGAGHLRVPVSPPLGIAFLWVSEIVSEVRVSGKRL